jgi:large subunit ribosomal protein L21
MLSALQRAAGICARAACAVQPLAARPLAARCFAVVTEPRAFVVVRVLGSQYKVTPTDKIVTSAMPGAIGQEVTLSDVLLVGSSTSTIIGSPLVKNSFVTAVVEEQTLADKVIVFKKRRRKNYRRRTAHRQSVTTLRITSITVPDNLML